MGEYRFRCEVVDVDTDEVVICDHVSVGDIDQFGGNESIDWAVARMLRQFKQTARERHERSVA